MAVSIFDFHALRAATVIPGGRVSAIYEKISD
jgi:hypothetical protein